MRIWKNYAVLLGALLAVTMNVHAQEPYPSRSIKMLVPWAAGNLTDGIGRKLSDALSKAMKQPVWVENKGGASGQIGMEALSKAAPDGYTIGIGAIGPLAMNPALYDKLPYEPVHGFTPIAMLWSGAMVALVRNDSPVKSVKDLVALANGTPEGLSYATPGNGTLQHVTAELLRKTSGAKLVHVAYSGSNQASMAVLGGHVPVLFETLSVALPFIKAGKLRAIAVSTAQRSPLLPEVPTIIESGFPGVETDGWICLIAPKGLPTAIQQRLNAEVQKIVKGPAFQSWASSQGGKAVSGTPEELGAYMETEARRLGALIQAAGIRLSP